MISYTIVSLEMYIQDAIFSVKEYICISSKSRKLYSPYWNSFVISRGCRLKHSQKAQNKYCVLTYSENNEFIKNLTRVICQILKCNDYAITGYLKPDIYLYIYGYIDLICLPEI